MAVPRPPQGIRWLLTQTSTYAILAAVCVAVVGVTSAWNLVSQGKTNLALLAGSGAIGVLLFTAAQQVIGLAAARKKESTHECRLRLAIHVPVGESLEQITVNRRGFFTPERQELILAAVNGIAVFIGKRYA